MREDQEKDRPRGRVLTQIEDENGGKESTQDPWSTENCRITAQRGKKRERRNWGKAELPSKCQLLIELSRTR